MKNMRYKLVRESLAVFLFAFLMMVAPPRVAAAPATLYFAQFAQGTNGGTTFQTTLQIFNPANQTANVTITVTGDDGNPLDVNFTVVAGAAVTNTGTGVFTLTMPAHGLEVLASSGTSALKSGWAQVTAGSVQVNANAFFQQIDGSGNLLFQTAVPNVEPTDTFTGLIERTSDNTIDTGIALANPGAVTAHVTMGITNPDGTAGATSTLNLSPGQHMAEFVSTLFPSFTGQGTLAVVSDQGVIAVFLRLDHTQYASLPLFSATLFPPTLAGLSPSEGAAFTTVTIAGTNFDTSSAANNRVIFGGTEAGVVSVSTTSLVATVPTGLSKGSKTTVPVTVTTNGGMSNALNFTVDAGVAVPVITSLSPDSAAVGAGSTIVTINGRNFATDQGTAIVKFGAAAPFATPSFQVIDSTKATMTLTSDLLAQTGSFHVIFGNINHVLFGSSETDSAPATFTVTTGDGGGGGTNPPSVVSLSPSSGQLGQTIVLNGTNFDATNNAHNVVTFNGVQAVIVAAVTTTRIQVSVPSNATTGPVVVTTNGLASNSDVVFTVLATPALRTVAVGIAPNRVAYDPNTNQALVTDGVASSGSGDIDAVSFVDVASAKVTATVPSAGSNPFGIALTPDGKTAVVANFAPIFLHTETIAVIDVPTATLAKAVTLEGMQYGTPLNVAIDSQNDQAVITDFGSDIAFLALSDPFANTVVPGSTANDVVIYNPSPDVDWAVITETAGGSGAVLIYDLLTRSRLGLIPVGANLQGVAVTKTGMAVVSDFVNSCVYLINLIDQTVVKTIAVGSYPRYVAIDSLRNRAVVANQADGTISVIDLTQQKVIATLSTGGSSPIGVAISETNNLALVANNGSGTLGLVLLP